MRAHVITLIGQQQSESMTEKLLLSSENVGNHFKINVHTAVTPDRAEFMMRELKLKWTWPWKYPERDMSSGLTKIPYPTNDPRKRVACFLSHYELWLECAAGNEDFMILEHDAQFVRRAPLKKMGNSIYQVIAMNNPIGATFMSREYAHAVLDYPQDIAPVPAITTYDRPQGLPGNSAYYLKPDGASRLIQLVKDYGAWPNDAIMCRQLMPKKLGVLKEYCTTVQKGVSTTSQ